MIFNSIEFALFFIAVFCLYWLIPRRPQNLLLIAASYLFYGWWDWRFLSLIVASTLLDFISGQRIYHTKDNKMRKLWLLASLVGNLGILAVFKYADFFLDSLDSILGIYGQSVISLRLNLILPVGISFYTFQTMSYTIDIYRGKIEPSYDLGDFALFVAFFPQLVAGPIERAKVLLPQFQAKRRLTARQLSEGLHLIFWGLFKKIYVADNLAVYVDRIFSKPEPASLEVLTGVWAFAFQIYGDFSGYSDIARGTAKCLGIELRINFSYPYFSTSIRQFWQKWHMSLSNWLRDYLYISLGGSHKGARRTYYNLMITMLLCGLWHGAAWTFVIWGIYHGLLLAAHRIWINRPAGKPADRSSTLNWALITIKALITFNLVNIGWLIFRSQSLEQVSAMVYHFLSFKGDWEVAPVILLLKFAAPLIAMESVLYSRKIDYLFDLQKIPKQIITVVYGLLFYLLVFHGEKSESFIYFQF